MNAQDFSDDFVTVSPLVAKQFQKSATVEWCYSQEYLDTFLTHHVQWSSFDFFFYIIGKIEAYVVVLCFEIIHFSCNLTRCLQICIWWHSLTLTFVFVTSGSTNAEACHALFSAEFVVNNTSHLLVSADIWSDLSVTVCALMLKFLPV